MILADSPDQNAYNGEADNPFRAPQHADSSDARLPDLGDPIAQLEASIQSEKDRPWTASVYADRIRFTRTGDTGFDLLRREFFAVAELRDYGILKRSIIYRLGKKSYVFRFSEADHAVLKQWIQPLRVTDLRLALKRRFALLMPIAFIFVVLAMFGEDQFEPTGAAIDVVSLLQGLTLMLMVGISRLVTHRIFYLLDVLWFSALGAEVIYDVLSGSSPLWLILVVALLPAVSSGIREYVRFADVQPDAVEDVPFAD